jgi:ABC-type transport system substrate-binding protein
MIFPMIPRAYAQTRGPKMDVLRHTVVRTPEAARYFMLGDNGDFSPDQIRTSDITAQKKGADDTLGTYDDMLVTQDVGFHMGYIASNVRDTAWIQANYRPAITYWPLHDVEFRHALIHCYDQLAIIPAIYGFIVSPVQSLVPIAQSAYVNPGVPKHQFDPGVDLDPDSPDYMKLTYAAGTSTGILDDAGYVFVDNDADGIADADDYWKMPNGDPLPKLVLWTPLATDAPTSFEHGARFVEDLAKIGLRAGLANGWSGIINEGKDFNDYLYNYVFGKVGVPGGKFDMFMVFHGLDRLPTQLYWLCHSSQDSFTNPGQSNGPGVNDTALDALAEKVRYSLDLGEIANSAKEIQSMLYTPDKTVYPNADNFALAWMLLYSRSYFNVAGYRMEGVVKSPGYGSDNGWTFMNAYFEAGEERLEDADGDTVVDETVMIYVNGLPPESVNPTFAGTAYEWNIVNRLLDGLTDVNPYNHVDIPWVATDWSIKERAYGMDVNFTIRDDIYWQDGHHVNATDIEFSMEALRDYGSINWADSSAKLIDVEILSEYKVTVKASEAGLSLFYSYAGCGLILPPQIYDRAWGTGGEPHITQYNPDEKAYGTDMAPGYSAGPWASDVPTNLIGTGPWIFRFYSESAESDDMWANRNYFLTQTEIANMLTDMFWLVGDYTGHPLAALPSDGVVNVIDATYVSFAVGNFLGDPDYDVAADFNSNNFVGITDDLAETAYHLLWQKEWP